MGIFFPSISPQLLSPEKSLCCTHLPCTRHVGSGTLQPLTFSSSTPFQGSQVWDIDLFSPSSPLLWWIHPNSNLELEVGTRRLNSETVGQIGLPDKSQVSLGHCTVLADREEGRGDK